MRDKKTPRRYAKALLMRASEKKMTEQIFENLSTIQTVIEQSPEFRNFLVNPIVKETEKQSVFKALFENQISREVLEFLNVLCAKGRENFLPDIIDAFMEMRREQMGVIQAEVVSVVDLNSAQVEDLKNKLKTLTGKMPELRFRKDPALIGGFLVRYGDTVIDGSVKRQLEKLREQFTGLRTH
jgi:F-type H+-transporting ATPase subunit delta